MRMSELIRDLGIEGAETSALEVGGIAHDSRRVRPGDLFVTWRGMRFDGREHVPEAIERGAAAVLSEPPAVADAPVPWLVADDPHALLAPLAARLYGRPDRELLHIGVTGTNGKSTVLELVAHTLEAAARPTGRLGTLGYRFPGLDEEPGRTTPEASDYFRLLREMRQQGATAVVAEVSSHALALGRVAEALYDVAVLTNLTRDHLDFHGDLESYFTAKRRLFEQLKPGGRTVANADDAFGRRLLDELPATVGYGTGAEVRALDLELDLAGIRGEVSTPRGRLRIDSRLLGAYNASNLLAAVAVGEALELPHAAVAEGLASCPPLPGRLELVSRRGGFPALVDYAHTEAALAALLESVRALDSGRLIVVFGCGGDRDRGKRRPMGRVAGELADLAILTSDNPRSEDPRAIVEEVEKGLADSGGRYRVEVDRGAAIREAIAAADRDSVVVVAGKGHERTQTIGDRELPFSDREQILEALEERFGPSKGG